MIGYIKGKVLFLENDGTVLVDVNQVGYSVLCTQKFCENLQSGQNSEFWIHTHVREDALELFGFESAWEKKIFLLLTSVSGIGPRTAMGVLGHIDGMQFLEAIVREDKPLLTSVSGIGKKTADRLIVELAEKASKLLAELCQSENAHSKSHAKGATESKQIPMQGAQANMSMLAEAVEALNALGYREIDAWKVVRETVSEADGQTYPLQTVIRKSLQRMAKA